LIQSIASRSLPDDHILFEEHTYTVTPSWLQCGKNSYAIRTITRLTLRESRDVTFPLKLTMGVSVLLVIWLLWRFLFVSLPTLMFWVLLILSVLVGVGAAYMLYWQLPRYRLDVHFNDATALGIAHSDKDVIQRLHEALALAMDWHRGDAVHSAESTPTSLADGV